MLLKIRPALRTDKLSEPGASIHFVKNVYKRMYLCVVVNELFVKCYALFYIIIDHLHVDFDSHSEMQKTEQTQ